MFDMLDMFTILAEMFKVLGMIGVSFTAFMMLSLFAHIEPHEKEQKGNFSENESSAQYA